MFASRRSLTALMFSGAVLLAGPALAVDAPVATANPDAPSVAAQIDAYLKTSPAIELPKDTSASGITPGDGADEPRQVHGVVDVAVGNHGYRSAYVRSDFPVGKTGTLSVAVQQTEGRGYGYGGYGGYGYGGYGGYGGGRGFGGPGYRGGQSQNLAVGFAFGGASASDTDSRCRGMDRHRIDQMYTGRSGEDRCARRDTPPEDR